MQKSFRKWVVWYLVAAMFVIGITPRVYAGFSPSEAIKLSQAERSQDLQKIQKILEMKMVRERLKDLGFTPSQIQERINQLDTDQLHQLALKLDDLKVGGDGLAILIALLLIAILVVVVLQLTGHRIIVK